MNINGPPVYYDYLNTYTASQNPSTVHVTDTRLSGYFVKYLLQRAISVFKWTLPETWNEDYFKYVLYCYGYISVVNTDRFGVICQQCGLRGYNVYYQPTHAIIVNPLINRTLEPQIGTQCEIIKLQPNYTGILDIVTYYADLMALISSAVAVSAVNSKVNYVFAAGNKAIAESIKKMFDNISSGNPAVVVDNKLFDPNTGKLNLEVMGGKDQSTVVNDLIMALNTIESMFDREIGLPVMVNPKKERDLTDQIITNYVASTSKSAMWLDELQKQVEKVNQMFRLNINVDWRQDLLQEGDFGNASNLNTGSV